MVLAAAPDKTGQNGNKAVICKGTIKRKVPLLAWLPTYTASMAWQDALAGFTVALTEVPQGIAYAIVAGLPSQYGLYSGYLGCFVYLILGTCKSVTIGPTAIMSLLVQSHVTAMGVAGAILITFLSGCFILSLGLLHLGFIVDFFSYPVTAGFTTAAALNTAASQAKALLGIRGKSDAFLDTLISVFKHISETRKWDAILGLLSIIFLVISKELRRYGTVRPDSSKRRNTIGRFIFMFSLASNAIAVIIGTTVAYILKKHGVTPFILTGDVAGGFPRIQFPPFSTSYNGTYFTFIDMAREYGSAIVFCPLIAILEHIAIAKAFCLTLRKKINWKKAVRRKVPLTGRLPSYTLAKFLQDAVAGFTVAVTEIPQGTAFAILAGLPPNYGLYSGIMGGFVYYFFGTCTGVTIGPTAVMARLVQPHVKAMGEGGAILICFLTGCIVFILGLLRLGFITEFVSYPVVTGFTTAAVLYTIVLQTYNILGISQKSSNFLKFSVEIFTHIRNTKKWDVMLGMLTIIFLVVSREIRKLGSRKHRSDWSKRRNIIGRCIYVFSIMSNAIAVAVGIILGYVSQKNGTPTFTLTGDIDEGLPPFKFPSFTTNFNGTHFSFIDMVENYGTAMILCPLIAVIELLATGKIVSKGRKMDGSQELMALGLTNIMGSFVHSMPLTGSLIRTSVNLISGVRSMTSGVVAGTTILIALGTSTEIFEYIPKATLAAVIIVSVFYFCDFAAFGIIWRTKRSDLIPFVVTIVSCLVISLDYGILIGVLTNAIFLLYKTARPRLDVEKSQKDIYVVNFGNELYFSAAEHILENILKRCVGEKTTVVIDGRYLENVDATMTRCFSILREELEKRDQHLVFLNINKSVAEVCVKADKKLDQHFRENALEQTVIHRITSD